MNYIFGFAVSVRLHFCLWNSNW